MTENIPSFVNLKERYDNFMNNEIDLHNLHSMVYDPGNVALAVKKIRNSNNTYTYGNLRKYSIDELSKIVEYRLKNKVFDYLQNDKNLNNFKFNSILDKLVEMCIVLVIEPYCETKFVPSSYAYRKGSSNFNALSKVKSQLQSKEFVLQINIDNLQNLINPNILYREMWHIGIKDKYILNYIFRFIKNGYIKYYFNLNNEDFHIYSSLIPLILNIYIHRFDIWFRDQSEDWWDKSCSKFHNKTSKTSNLSRTNLKIGTHIRFLNKILICCKTYNYALRFKYSISNYLKNTMKLDIDNIKIYDLDKENLTFLNYTFRRNVKNKGKQQKYGRTLVSNFLDNEKIDEYVKTARQILNELKELPNTNNAIKWNVFVLRIHNYYKGMNHFYKSMRKISWRISKKFNHVMTKIAKQSVNSYEMNSFLKGRYSTWGKNNFYTINGLIILNIGWANWDKCLINTYKQNLNKIYPNPYVNEIKMNKNISDMDYQYLLQTSIKIRNSNYAILRISKYCNEKGCSLISGEYVNVHDYHCHHIIPKYKNGIDSFDNLCVLTENEHKLIHLKDVETLVKLYPSKIRIINNLIDNL